MELGWGVFSSTFQDGVLHLQMLPKVPHQINVLYDSALADHVVQNHLVCYIHHLVATGSYVRLRLAIWL